jgi:hypothetical protein
VLEGLGLVRVLFLAGRWWRWLLLIVSTQCGGWGEIEKEMRERERESTDELWCVFLIL